MPFHQRTVAPPSVRRLNQNDGRCLVRVERESGTAAGTADAELQTSAPFATLEEVCCHTLLGVVRQLSDLSRHAGGIFLEIETEVAHVARRSGRLRLRLETLQSSVRKLEPRKVKIPVSNLDEESKWTVHYSAPWHQQENVFLPSTRPACVEDLHRQAKVNLKNVLRDCDKLRKDGFRSSQYYSQGPIFSGSNVSDDSLQEDEEADKKSEASLEDEDEKPMYSARPQSDDGYDAGSSAHSGWSKTNPLPTPEERMRQQAQAVPADIIPINITAARGHSDLRPHSMYLPGQFSNPGSANPGLRRTNTRDFSCQTEEVKIVPPSMRRIRAQRGQGIAAQMAVLSASSSGSISTASDSVGNISIFMAQHNGGSQRFHSLPRQGARISLNFEPDCGSAPYRPEDCSAGSPQTQNGRIQADDTTVHLRNSLRAGAMPRPKSEEVRSTLSDQPMGGPACAVSPHTAFSTSLIPNATLSCSAEVITIHTANSCGGSVTPQVQVSTYPPERASSTAAVNGGLSATSSHRDSAVSLSTNTEADSQCSTLNGTKSMNSQDTTSESSYSDGSFQSRGTIGADHWVYDTPEKVLPKRPLTSSCSTPTNHIYSSLERSSNKTDASSLHSIDNDGYYTSMHTDSGLRSRSHNNIHRQMRHSMYECRSRDNQDDHTSFYSDKSLSRSISLRKLKKPPLPPARTDSLRRKPGKKTGTNGSILNETLIASLQQSLQMGIKAKGSSSPSQSPCSDYEDPWVLRSRSQSSVSAGSSGPNMYYICPITPSQSDTSSLRSDYAESWGYYADYPRAHGEQPQSLASTPGEYSNGSCLPVIAQASLPVTQDGAVAVKPKAATSPDRVHRLTSPSSGYSSQSNTPTAGTPVPSFMRPMSPAGLKAKPKVPERKSSLLSSVSMSSSSTSLSSNTSDSTRNPLPPPLLSMTIPHTSPSMTPTFTLPKEPLLTPPPPPTPPASIPACTVENFIPPPLDPVLHPTPVMTQDVSISSSDFPPPPPEVLFDSILLVNETESQLLPPPPPPLPPLLAMTPPAAPPISFREGALRPLNANFTDSVAKEDSRLASSCSGEARKSPMPLVTTQDLQKVQLRSVKKLEHEGAVTTKAQETGHDLKSIKPRTPEKNKNLQPPNVLSLTVCSSPTPNGAETQPSPTKQAGQEAGTLDIMLAESLEDHSEDSSRHKQTYLGSPDEPPLASPAVPSLNLTPKKKPPAISKKPKLSFMIPQTHGQPVSEEGQTRVQEADMTASGFSFSGIIERHGEPLQQEESNNSRISKTPLMQGRESLSSEVSADNLQVAKTSALVTQGLTLTDDKSSSEKDHNGDRDGDPSSTMGSICSKQEENGDVFEDSDASHTPTAADRDVCEDMVTPTRPRTTEDLFAAIHRSKRKVLGRRESDEERSQGHSPSPPVTPTSGSPGLACPPRQTGSIQRSLRRSATSSDSFKALLLKKGSRSEAGFRMSATEMLKSTDPRFQRSRLESSPESPVPDSPSGSPGRGKRVPEEWARTEGLSTRFAISSSHSGPKYGRSRMPPSAASSKYNARSRILSSPMTVICEREGELTEGELAEASNDCEDIEGPPPPPQASNGTSCEGDGS